MPITTSGRQAEPLMAGAKDKDAPARRKARGKPGKPKGAPAAANRRLAQQTRKQLAKHYASKYKTGPR